MKPVLWALLLTACAARVAGGADGPAGRPRVEYAFTIWDWVKNYRDIDRFRRLVRQLKATGFNTIELSVAWKDVQPEARGKFHWAYTDARVHHVRSQGLRLRVRINFSYAHPWPKWVRPQLAVRHDGKQPATIMTIFDDELNAMQIAAAEAIVAHYKGRGIEWCPVFGVHTEVKLSSWLSYEPPARAAFRKWLRGRYGSLPALGRAWGKRFAAWDRVQPPVCRSTGREGDLSAESCDWIAFREASIAAKTNGLLAAVRRADPGAPTSVILGESFRRGSAAMANLAYQPYSRHADRVVFAYDFNWHGSKHREAAATSLEIMQGVSGKPTVFEFGGPSMIERNEYTDDDMVVIGRLALRSGAVGLNMCNYCYTDKPPSAFGHLKALAREVARLNASPPKPRARPTRLYYVSKWAHYALRDARSEWAHEKQFAPYRRLRAKGLALRIISDDNLLTEDFDGITQIHVAPPLVIDSRAADRLRELGRRIKLDPPDAPAGAAVLRR